MPDTIVGIMEIIGPAVLLIVLIALVVRGRSDRSNGSSETTETEKGTRQLYREEDIRRREGTDDL